MESSCLEPCDIDWMELKDKQVERILTELKSSHCINIIPFVGISGHHPIFEVHLIHAVLKDCLCCCLEVAGCHYAEQMSNFFSNETPT